MQLTTITLALVSIQSCLGSPVLVLQATGLAVPAAISSSNHKLAVCTPTQYCLVIPGSKKGNPFSMKGCKKLNPPRDDEAIAENTASDLHEASVCNDEAVKEGEEEDSEIPPVDHDIIPANRLVEHQVSPNAYSLRTPRFNPALINSEASKEAREQRNFIREFMAQVKATVKRAADVIDEMVEASGSDDEVILAEGIEKGMNTDKQRWNVFVSTIAFWHEWENQDLYTFKAGGYYIALEEDKQ